MSDRLGRLVPLTGVAFALLSFVGIFAANNNSPDAKASGEKVIAFYQAHHSDARTSDFVFFFASIFFLFFAGSLRARLRRAPGAEAASALLLAGASLVVVGINLFGGLDLALADQPSRLTPAAAQALNLLAQDVFFPVAAGSAVFGISAGVAILRGAELPKWLGWVVIVVGVITMSPGFFVGFLGLFAWALVVGVLMYLRPAGSDRPAVTEPV